MTGADGVETVHTYTYDDNWKDQLLSYDGKTITYDCMGRPTNYLGTPMTWNACGKLETVTGKNGEKISYSYLSDGQRYQKTVNGKTTALRCGKSGKVYRQLDDFYAACHIDKRHADWVAYQKADGAAAKGTGCHIVKNKGWACKRWQDVDVVNIQSKSELGCNDRDYDESSVVR